MTETTFSWPSGTRVHPATELLPMMTGPQIDELARDIGAHGLQQPITVFPGENGPVLLDGRNRLAAICRIPDQQRRETLLREISMGQHVVTVSANTDPSLYILSANIHRRHLTPQQKRELISALLESGSSRSDRAI